MSTKENRIAVQVTVVLSALLFGASCRTTTCSDRDHALAIEEMLQTRLPGIEVRNGDGYDIVRYLRQQVAERHGGRTFFLMDGRPFFETNTIPGIGTVTYKASNVIVSAVLHEITRQMGMTTGVIHGALVIGTPQCIKALNDLPSLPTPANRRLAKLLDKRWEGEWGVCQADVFSLLSWLALKSGIPTDPGYTTEWPYLFVRQPYCDLRIRDLLWWTGATAGKEVVLVDDGVSFREREGTVVTNAWYIPPAKDVPEIALAASIWPQIRQVNPDNPGGYWMLPSTSSDKTAYGLDLGFRPERAQMKTEKAFARGLARLGWLPQSRSVKSPGAHLDQTYCKGSRRLEVCVCGLGGCLTMTYWEDGKLPKSPPRP